MFNYQRFGNYTGAYTKHIRTVFSLTISINEGEKRALRGDETLPILILEIFGKGPASEANSMSVKSNGHSLVPRSDFCAVIGRRIEPPFRNLLLHEWGHPSS